MRGGDPLLEALGEAGIALGFTLFLSPMGPLMVDSFPASQRATGIALSYGASVGVVGGIAPLVVGYLMRETGDPMAPAWAIIGTALVSGAALLLSPWWQGRAHAAQPEPAPQGIPAE